MWLRIFEVWLTARLISSPTFQRAVQRMHKRVKELQHGKDPSELGGTNLDKPEPTKRFSDYFLEELKDQFRGGKPKN